MIRIEAVKHAIESLPVTPKGSANLRETARLFSTHYSTMIEGNLLTQEQVALVIGAHQHFPGHDSDQREVRGYYAALDNVEGLVKRRAEITKKHSAYRDGQNVIKDSKTKRIVYMPPEARDVPTLMAAMIAWIDRNDELPVPLKAAIAHYQYATIHPYCDGKGRTARLLATLVHHRGGYDLKGLYALEEYYARDLKSYYEVLAFRPSHDYYIGRVGADITGWIAYFIAGMAVGRRPMPALGRGGISSCSQPFKTSAQVSAEYEHEPTIGWLLIPTHV